MDQRENILKLWRREGFEFQPVHFDLCPALERKFHEVYGEEADYRDVFEFPFRNLRTGFLRQEFRDWNERCYPGREFLPGTSFSIWGVAHEPMPESMHMSRMYHPMQNFTTEEEFASYPYPEFDPSQAEECRREVEALHARGIAAMVPLNCTIWETAWYMRSMEEMMVGMMTDDPLTERHFERITVLAEQRAAAFASCGADLLHLGDDIGMQQTIMMSHELYRKHLKPRLARVVQAAKAAKPDMVITYHSCGYVTPFITDLMEAGVEVLNPVQPECMDFAEIHAEYGKKLSFWGTVGTQSTMPFGTPDEVKAVVRRNLEIAGEAGGLLCTPTHLLEPEVPWENIEAYVEACREFRLA